MEDNTYQLQSSPQSTNFKIDYENELNAEQLAVVKTGDGPTLVLAGAGSGKTKTLVYRVAYLLEKGVNPEHILLVTFTNKASKEMMARVEQLFGRKPKGLWGGTFHSVANRLLRQYATYIGYTNNFGILDSDDQDKLFAQVHKELTVPKASYFPKKRVIKSIISYAKNSQKPIKEIIETSYPYLLPEVIPVIERIAEVYEAKKKASNVMDFDDLLVNWLKLLQTNQEISQRICSKFEYVLVDEFQDTNTVQAALVHYLSQPQGNILVVGDDAQSIYSFRAATVENILSFQKQYPAATMHKLEMNYRSTPDILALANQSIRNNRFQYEKELKAFHKPFRKPILVPTRDSQQQAEVISQRILELREKNVSLDQMCVLFRSSFQIIELELELNKRGIPYLVRGGLRFFEQAHIKDVLAYLQVLHNPLNEIAWRRIFSSYEGVGQVTASKVWNKMKDKGTLTEMLSVLGDVPGRGKAKASFGRLQRLFFKLLEVEKKSIGQIITAILEQGYQLHLEATYDDARDRLEDLNQLAIFSSNYEQLDEFLAEASLSEGFKGEKAGKQEEAPDEQLLLSTIHQAKGLEWDVVFVMGVAENQFPHYKVADKPKEIEEERRLFYVAVTRPRKELYILYPVTSRSYQAGEVINRPSQFIREVDEDLFETWQVSEVQSEPVVALKSQSERMSMGYIDEEDDSHDNEGTSIFDMMKNI
jgi:DNA helicase II / ATP-dependent DNA helicase PcrA